MKTRFQLHSLLLLCLLAACTASFTYNHLDALIPWYAGTYVDLDRDQKKTLKAQLEPFLTWHREEELQRYIEVLDLIEADLDSSLTAGQVQSWIEEIIIAVQRIEIRMLQLGLEFGAELSDAQLREFVASLRDRYRDDEEEFLDRTDDEYAEDNLDYLSAMLKKLMGRLLPAQKDRLEMATSRFCRFDHLWLADREEWLQQLDVLVHKEDGWEAAVMSAFKAHKSARIPGYDQCIDQNLELISSAVAEVINMSSEKQQNHLHKEISSLRARIKKLMERKAR